MVRMEMETLTVKLIDAKDIESCKEIALQAWNIKRVMTDDYFDLRFLEGSNKLEVKYTMNTGNLNDLTDLWGEVLEVSKEKRLAFNSTDLTKQALRDLDTGYECMGANGYTSDVSMTFEE